VPIRFEDAMVGCRQILQQHLDEGSLTAFGRVVLVRDLMGRIHLALEKSRMESLPPNLLTALASASGPFWADHVMEGTSMMAPDAVFQSEDAVKVGTQLWLLERTVTGSEWGRPPLANSRATPRRAALFGLKGGVGRSTALCVWARHLAALGKRVLVIDLDLESPGVSSLLLPSEASADYGLVDWFVEDAVGNADAELLRLMVAPSPAADGTAGTILVAPCKGTLDNDYLAKLSRAYLDLPGQPSRHFGERVGQLVDHLEKEHSPDVVLLDSRAGLHDLAGVALTRMNAMTFLFAGGSRQTWDGYRSLFQGWAKYPGIAREVRDRVRVVASLVPETDREPYLTRLCQVSYDTFADSLYEEHSDATRSAFNFDINAIDAPHYPLNIYWSRAFQEWDPATGAVTPQQVMACYGDFLGRATDLVLSESASDGGANGRHE
jgi:CobQ/CobB/MinD/ParA nucleotide binding domain